MNDKILMGEDKDLGWDTMGQILDSRLPMLRKSHAGSWALQNNLSSYRAQKVVQRNGSAALYIILRSRDMSSTTAARLTRPRRNVER